MLFRANNHPGSQTGFTLLEAAMALVITGIVIGALWILSSNVFSTHSINQLEKGVVGTASRIRNFYRDRQIQNDKTGNASNVNNVNFIGLDLIAPELPSTVTSVTNGNPPVTTYTGTISFSPSFNGTGTVNITYDKNNCAPLAANSFAMTLANMTKDGCNQLLPRLAGTGGAIQSNGVIGIFAGGTNNAIVNNAFVVGNTACTDGANVEICFAQF